MSNTKLIEGEKEKEEEEVVLEPWPVVKDIFSLSLSPIVSCLFHPAYMLMNNMVLGRQADPVQLAAFGLGSLTNGIFVLSIGVCFAYGVATQVGQAYGAGNLRLCRVYLNRQYFLNTCVFCVVLIPMLFIRSIYRAIGQNDRVADLAAQYVWICLPGIFWYFHQMALQLYSNAHKVLYYAIISMAGAAAVHALILAIFCAFDQQFLGVCVASSAQFFARFLIQWLLVAYGGKFDFPECHDVRLFSKETVVNLRNQIVLGLASCGMGVWGWWAFEIFTLMASYLSEELIAGQTIMRSLGLLTYMIPVGFSFATQIKVGHFIGCGNQAAIKYYFAASMYLAIGVAVA